jgi:hypothetical protein
MKRRSHLLIQKKTDPIPYHHFYVYVNTPQQGTLLCRGETYHALVNFVYFKVYLRRVNPDSN